MTEKINETIGQFLFRIAQTNRSTDKDSQVMEYVLRRLGFSKARVVTGIVYLHGKGTIEAPPSSIHSVAKNLYEQLTGEKIE